ncbi:MAG: alanine racemase [Planctomycetes bacterium]|nr:alanine racemase [Planctomycetota bacterium]
MIHPHRVWADIRLDHLRDNCLQIRKRLPKSTRLMAVVKADAYGHGAVEVARELQAMGVDRFGVGDSGEALELRAAGIAGPIVILGAIIDGEQEQVVTHGLEVTIHSESRIDHLAREARRQQRRCRVHLKVDTGMGRLGVLPQRAMALLRRIAKNPWLELAGVATHFAGTGAARDAGNEEQLARFLELREQVRREGLGQPLWHAAASAALFSDLKAELDLVRPGGALWGIAPADAGAAAKALKPVLSLHTQVIFLKDVPAGTPIGYQRTWRTPQKTRIATVPLGYNDGLPLRLGNRGFALVRGARAPIVGRVSMDYTMLDVGRIRGVKVGEPVTLIGRDGDAALPVEEVAELAGTLPYEVLCSLGRRVARVYHASRRGAVREALTAHA